MKRAGSKGVRFTARPLPAKAALLTGRPIRHYDA